MSLVGDRVNHLYACFTPYGLRKTRQRSRTGVLP